MVTPEAGTLITNLIGSYGFPVALVLLVGFFFDKRIWPFLVTIVERQQTTDAQRATNEAKLDEQLVSVIESNTQTMSKVGHGLDALIQGQEQLRKEFTARMDVLEKGQRILAHRFKEHEERPSG